MNKWKITTLTQCKLTPLTGVASADISFWHDSQSPVDSPHAWIGIDFTCNIGPHFIFQIYSFFNIGQIKCKIRWCIQNLFLTSSLKSYQWKPICQCVTVSVQKLWLFGADSFLTIFLNEKTITPVDLLEKAAFICIFKLWILSTIKNIQAILSCWLS